MKRFWIFLLVLPFCTAATAQTKPWSLEPCATTGPAASSRAKYAAAVRAAAPDTPLYTPHPFPTTTREVFEDFVVFHVNAFRDTPKAKIPPEQLRLLTALETNQVRYEVFKVEDWTPLRCGSRKARDTWSVLRIFDMKTGDELVRATVDNVGHVGRLRLRPVGGSLTPILDLSAARASVRAVAPGAGNAEYVTTWGLPGCEEVTPCVAMREGPRVYLVDGRTGALFLLTSSSKRLSFRHDLSRARREDTLRGVAHAGARLMSLGQDAFAQFEAIPGRGARQDP